MNGLQRNYASLMTQLMEYPLDPDEAGIIFAYSEYDFVGHGHRDTCAELLNELNAYGFAWDLINL